MSTQHHNSHPDSDIAYHFDWEFRRESLLWVGEQPIGINFHPLATELYNWLLRKGQVSLLLVEETAFPISLTNPYSYNTSVIAGIITHVINGTHDFATSTEPMSDTEAEIERIRLYNEQVLYTARFCEAAIKQLLYCTQISKRYYEDVSIGTLLSAECRDCKGAGKARHKISMLGSLAHRYGLCLEFEGCLFEHLKIVNRRRNVEAAHSGTQPFRMMSTSDSRAQLMKDSLEAGNELVHMLKHISDLETHMISELNSIIGRSIASKFIHIAGATPA
jgi:hypothetical protein